MIAGFLDLLRKHLGQGWMRKGRSTSPSCWRRAAHAGHDHGLLDFSRIGKDQDPRTTVNLADALTHPAGLRAGIEKSGRRSLTTCCRRCRESLPS